LPAVSFSGQAAVAYANEASLATNRQLKLLLGIEALLPKVKIYMMHGYPIFADVAADSTPPAYSPAQIPISGEVSHFGFLNFPTPCVGAPPAYTVCADPDHTFFWDAEHPTEFGHLGLALLAEAALNGQPETFGTANQDDNQQ